MTVINIATDLPNSITTLEQIAAWSNLALRTIYPTLEAVEGVGINERVAQAGIFYVASSNYYRMLNRTSLLVSPDHLIGGAKMWTYVQEFGSTALPAGFKS
ncbi:MAG: glucose-6-phosphate dehydrogenase [Verrucomicrobia bacterium]|nr:glucose-6-phosphate dehydrogenase [Leptolyngbya sp. ES-bin-22]